MKCEAFFWNRKAGGKVSDRRSPSELVEFIIKLRNDIRWHRSQRGHDRCWLDDLKVYSNLPEYKNPYERELCGREEFLQRCGEFWERRQVPHERVTKELARKNWRRDSDLSSMDAKQLSDELARLRTGVRMHRERGDAKTWQDDRRLYALLPDETNAITTLPERERFLRGCKRFFSTRSSPPLLHEWR